MTKRRINTIHRAPRAPSCQPPLLFVHGGYVGANCWDLHFLPYFAALGYDCTALDLSGHGQSEGREQIHSFGLDDYLADVIQIIEGFEQKPILLGHSMGAVIAERVFEQSLAVAGVLISPVPPSGTWGSATNLALKHPRFFGEINNVTRGRYNEGSLSLMRDIYFSPEMEPKALLQFAELIQPESQRALADLLMLGGRFPRRLPELPILVMGGELDVVFPPDVIRYVALRWHADLEILPDMGHMLMLDRQWKVAAERIVGWLRQVNEASEG